MNDTQYSQSRRHRAMTTPHPRQFGYGSEGWTFGTLNGPSTKWLTVWGARWDAPAPTLHDTQEEARSALNAWCSEHLTRPDPARFTVLRVRMVPHESVSCGKAFRILDMQD
jgi:hypothetical protein